jgi:alkylhydroperoxidase family enzyme
VGEVRDLLNRLLPPGVEFSAHTPDRNLPCTVVKHPGVYEPWALLGSRLRGGLLPLHDRELVTLRVATWVGSPYEWAHHSRSAAAAGVTPEEMEAVQRGTEGPWDASTAAKLQAVDDIYASQQISDTTWSTLREVYDERQLIELIMLIGFYSMTGWLLNSAQIEVDAWLSEAK